MAFNPFKNRNTETPVEDIPVQTNNTSNGHNLSPDSTLVVNNPTLVSVASDNLPKEEVKVETKKTPAFNPFKNRNIEAPVPIEEDFIPAKEEIKQETSALNNVPPHVSEQAPVLFNVQKKAEDLIEYEGQKISDLEKSGLQTINLLKVASPNVIDKPKFNVASLETIPVNFVLESLGATKIKDNLYLINEQEISTKENKWFNKTQKRGHINSISLVKHLTAIAENINEQENSKTLFISACKKLTQISLTQNLSVDTNSESNKTNNAEPVNVQVEKKQEVTLPDSATPVQTKPQNIDWKALTEQLNNIPLDLVMEYLGANPNEDNQRGKWKVWKTGHNIHVTGKKWNDWNAQFGGYGGISLLAYHTCIDNHWNHLNADDMKQARKLAIKTMIKEFGTDSDINSFVTSTTNEEDYKVPFSMPHVISFKINEVKNYLNQKRQIPMWVINKQIKAGFLFAGHPSDWKLDPNLNNPEKLTNDKVWATFLALNGNAAEMRAIDRSDSLAKLLAKGSDKELGGFLIKAEADCNEKTFVACEAAIDSMSYHAFNPGHIAMSCMGVNFNLAAKTALESLGRKFNFKLAFDNDLAGNEAAVHFREKISMEIGEEAYQECIKDKKITLFDLGIQCFMQTINKGGTFYFDVKHNDIGRTATIMFQEQLFNFVPKETVKDLLQKGKIKYANIAPNYGLITNIEQEAQDAVNLLLTTKPLYILLKQGDEDEKEDIRLKRESFESAFKIAAGEHFEKFEQEGKIVYKKQAFAKDWNEFYTIMKKDLTFQEKLNNFEEQYKSYNEDSEVTKKNGKKP